ncbi:MAG: DUF3267 domain-containing protein [Anaerovoracaceae bacterium]
MKEHVFWELPPGYILEREVKLSEDRGALKIMAVLQLVLAAVLFGLGLWHHPIREAFSMGAVRTAAAFCFMVVGILIYFLAHEWVHGVFIRLFSGRSAAFGFELKKGMAYAYSNAFFAKSPYVVIALAPLVVWTVLLGLLLRDVPTSWFWYLYAIQIVNVSGAVGDLYVTWLTLHMPKGTLILDNGMEMRFYVKKQ